MPKAAFANVKVSAQSASIGPKDQVPHKKTGFDCTLCFAGKFGNLEWGVLNGPLSIQTVCIRIRPNTGKSLYKNENEKMKFISLLVLCHSLAESLSFPTHIVNVKREQRVAYCIVQ